MKKLLALVLALVMTLGLATVGANAAFADAESIEHDEAVEVLNTLGILGGKENNNFDPAGNVKRSEMAKMIAVAMLGADADASAVTGTATDLTDINGHWAEGWIKFCVSQGIVGGRGNGKFDPDDNVTTAEASKMLLVALGYSSDVQGYTGDSWAINVTRDAANKKLLENLTGMNANKAITRDEAAQMIWNTVQRTLIVKVAGQERTSDGKITDTYQDSGDTANPKYLLTETFEATIFVGTYAGNYSGGTALSTKKGEIRISDGKRENVNETANKTGYAPSDLGLENIGEQVKVIYKDNTSAGTANYPDKQDTFYGVYNTGKTTVVKALTSDISNSYVASDTKVKVGDETYDLAATANIIMNYNPAIGAGSTLGATAATGDTTLREAIKALNTTVGTNEQKSNDVKFTFNSDNEINGVYVTSYAMAYVTGITSEKVSVSGVAALKIADNEIYEGAAKDDVVVYTSVGDTADRG